MVTRGDRLLLAFIIVLILAILVVFGMFGQRFFWYR